MMIPLPRRLFLRNSSIAIGLPMLESMLPSRLQAAAAPPRRMVCIGVPFGFDPAVFVPVAAGRDYELPAHLTHLAAFRDNFTLISGLSHPNTGGGGHKAAAGATVTGTFSDAQRRVLDAVRAAMR